MEQLNAVVDLSHHNLSVDLKKAKAAGVLGVIQKATQGLTYVDRSYAVNRKGAAAAGLRWGAYHFGTGVDGVAQAAHFLQAVFPDGKIDPEVLLVLDFENDPQGPDMTLEEARAFITHVRAKTGRWPGLYSGHYVKEKLGSGSDPVLAQCWFWLSQYGPTPVVPVNWPTWALWQYTDGGLGPEPHEVDGIGPCDRDIFNGSRAEFDAFWLSGGADRFVAPRSPAIVLDPAPADAAPARVA